MHTGHFVQGGKNRHLLSVSSANRGTEGKLWGKNSAFQLSKPTYKYVFDEATLFDIPLDGVMCVGTLLTLHIYVLYVDNYLYLRVRFPAERMVRASRVVLCKRKPNNHLKYDEPISTPHEGPPPSPSSQLIIGSPKRSICQKSILAFALQGSTKRIKI